MAKIRDILFEKPRREPCSVLALDGAKTLTFAVRLLNGEETTDIEKRARLASGTAEPKPEDALFLRAKMVETILLSAVDEESPPEKSEPYFANAGEVLKYFDDARIAYVFQEQRAFQSKYAPIVESCDYEEFIRLTWASVQEAQRGGDPERPFVGLPYRKVVSFAAISAGALTSPALPQLLFGSPTTRGEASSASSATSSISSGQTTSSTTTQPEQPSQPLAKPQSGEP